MLSLDPDSVSSTSLPADKAMLVQYGDTRCPHAPEHADKKLPLVPIPRYVMDRIGLADDDAIGLVQSDAGMEPTIGNGDEGVIDPARRDPASQSGRVYAIAVGTSVITRRIIAGPVGLWLVSSDHPDKRLYPDVEAAPGQMTIIGQVRWTGGFK